MVVRDRELTCGLVLPQRVLDKLVAVLPRDGAVNGVRFLPCPCDSDASPTHPPLDCVLHRAMYDWSMRAEDATAAARWRLLEALGERLVDPIDRVLCFADRGKLCRKVDSCAVRQPKFAAILETTADLAAVAATSGLRYPLIYKPLIACGHARSHELAVVFTAQALGALSAPCLRCRWQTLDRCVCLPHPQRRDLRGPGRWPPRRSWRKARTTGP